jgi:hypothetical protein
MSWVLVLLLALAGTARAACDPALQATVTPRIKLPRPSTKMCNWDVPIQQAFDLLDASVGMTTFAQTWTAPQTFSAIRITAGTPSTLAVLQSDATGTGHWSETPTVKTLDVSQSLTVAGTPIVALPAWRLGGIYFDLGAEHLSINDEWPFRLDPFPATITRVECEAYTGVQFTIKLCLGEDVGDDTCTTDVLTAPLVCTAGGAFTTAIANSAVQARDKVTIIITSVGGPVTKGEIYIEGKPS